MSWLRRRKAARNTYPPAVRRCELVVVSAVSEGEWGGIADLLDSLATYIDCDYEVVIADDATTDGSHERLLDAGVWVVRNTEKRYLWGLGATLAGAYIQARRLFSAPIVLKIDPDALVIGPGLVAELRRAFAADPKVGLLGTYRIDWNGEARDLSYWAEKMSRRQDDFAKVLRRAQGQGYRMGDGVQGGAYALSGDCLDAIVRAGWWHGAEGYRPSQVKGLRIAEDSLIAMLTYAAGYCAAEFGGPDQPFGLAYRGLPMSPAELVEQQRLVTHSIKYSDEDSMAAREFFRTLRMAHRTKLGAGELAPAAADMAGVTRKPV